MEITSSAQPVIALRHAVATLAYRLGKTVRDVPSEFEAFLASPGTRTPAQILAHIGDLFDWALAMASGRHEWHDSDPLPWPREVDRVFRAIAAFDERLITDVSSEFPPEKLFSGPIADALTHTG